MKKHLEIKIKGEVQGVFFRVSAKQKAEEVGVFGWVRNLPGGGVEIEAEGEEEKLKELLSWSKIGPENAKVEKIRFKFSNQLQNFEDFKIKMEQ